jgi:hypothetical protein
MALETFAKIKVFKFLCEEVSTVPMLAMAAVLALANLPNGTQNQSYLCRITQGSQRSMATYFLVSLKTLCQFLLWTWIQLKWNHSTSKHLA